MSIRLTLLAAAFSSLVTGAARAADQHYGFNANAQGWTAVDGGGLSWTSSGGNSGGYLQIADTTDQDFLAVFPASALGDWSSYLGGTLSFDARNINSETPDWSPFGLVTLTGTTTLSADLIPGNQPPADGQWHHYVVPLTVAVWGAQLPSVLGSLSSVTIKGEFHAGVTEVVGLDNISVTAVPEPATPALMVAGLALVGIAALKRRS